MWNNYYSLFKYYCVLSAIVYAPEDDRDSTVVLQLPTGKIRGRVLKSPKGNSFYAFQQVPYAAPPVGNLRFQLPQPVQSWSGILDATNNTKVCHQGGMYQDARETEDCLHINIYVPRLEQGDCSYMPVLFYIFGGAFNAGHGGLDFYGPDLFMDERVIVVTFNYRTGALGFLTTEDNVIPPNRGLKDQVFALKWVNENIEIFGGNPSEITIMAHSSGAGAASYLLHSQETTGLFRAMIMQSGTSLSPGMVQKYGKYFAYKVGEIVSPYFGARNSSEDLLDLLLNVPANMFRDFEVEIPHHMRNALSNNTLMWAPSIETEVVDHPVVLGPMHENIKNGYFNKVPTLMGIVTQEEAEFITVNFPENEIHKFDDNPSLMICSTINIREEFKNAMGRDLRSIYTNRTFEEDYEAFINFYSSERFVTPMIRHAMLQSYYSDVYFYQFSYVGQLGRKSNIRWKGPRMVVHAEELAYIFLEKDTPSLDGFPETDVLTSERVIKMWANFIKYLNPTPFYDPLLQNVIWPTVDRNNFIYLDIGNDLVLQKDPKEYLAWKRVYDKYVDGPLDVY